MNCALPKVSRGYFYERVDQSVQGPRLLSAYYFVRKSRGGVNSFSHPFWVLDYSMGECGLCRVGKRSSVWLERDPGYAHLYPPGTRYWEDVSKAAPPLSSAFVTFQGGEWLDLEKYVNNGKGYGRFRDEEGMLCTLFLKVSAEAASGREASYWRAMSALYSMIDILSCSRETGRGNERAIAGPYTALARGREEMFVAGIRSYLQEHLGESVRISALARHMNTSASSVSHKYRLLAGESPMKTLAGFRINAAKGLLEKGEPMKSAASQTGFCDEFHLSKVFRKVAGISPSGYLKGRRRG